MKSITPNKPKLNGRNRPLDIRRVPANKRWTEADYFADAIGERSLRDAATWFNEGLPEIFHRSHTSIASYINEGVEPDPVFLHALKSHYPETDPRHQLAAELLALRERAAELEHA